MDCEKKEFLSHLNERLDGMDDNLNVDGKAFHNIFIVGAPRSGTTILNQLFAGCSDVGYVNNLMATFWRAPIAGALLSNRWMSQKYFSGVSAFGVTKDIREPHEFGGFWREQLHYPGIEQKAEAQGVDWNHLKNTLNNISRVFHRPVVYKVFQLYWHIREFHQVSPESKWIWIQRDTVDNAVSLLNSRRKKVGGVNAWLSAKPLGIEPYLGDNPHLEVVSQVELINSWLECELGKLSAENWKRITYESLSNETEAVFNDLCYWCEIDVIADKLSEASKYVRLKVENESEDKRLTNEAYERFKNASE